MSITGTFNGASIVQLPASPGFSSVEFNMLDQVALVSSPFTGQTQTQQWPGADMWGGTLTLPPLTQAQADQWASFLMELRGMANCFRLGDPYRSTPNGTALGTPVVDMGVANSNYLYESQGITAAPWYFSGGWQTPGTFIAGPDGGISGQSFITDSTSSTDRVFWQDIGNNNLMLGWTMTFSIYLRVPTGSANIPIFLIDIAGASGTVCAVNTNWQRFSVTRTIQSLTRVYVQVGGESSITQPNFTLDAAWAVVNTGTTPDNYYGLQTFTSINVTSTNIAGSQTLATRGWTPNQPGALAVGDYIQVGNRLHRVLDTVNADANGMATLSIWPSLREVPTDAEPVIVNNPTGLMRLSSNKRTWNVGQSRTTRISIPFMEFR